MITHGGMSEIMFYRRLKEVGLSKEKFFSLPYECQRAIIMAGNSENYDRKQKRIAFQKRMALKQYNFEEKVKEKVLKLLKKNK